MSERVSGLQGFHRAVRAWLKLRGAVAADLHVNGMPVHHYVVHGRGSGPPVVLVHGLGGSANGFARVMFPLGRAARKVVAPDLPGNGFSPLPACGPLSLERQVEVLTCVVERTVGEPAVVVGNSLGGAMAVALASRRRDLVRALVLVAPAGALMTANELSALRLAMCCETDAQARALTRRLFHKAPLPALLFASELKSVYGAPAVRHVFEHLGEKDALTPEVLGALEMPTLLLWGESEKLLPFHGIDYFRAHLPRHAEVEVVKGFGHVPQMEAPARLVGYIERFFRKHLCAHGGSLCDGEAS